jgi:protein-disulfide isomerase
MGKQTEPYNLSKKDFPLEAHKGAKTAAAAAHCAEEQGKFWQYRDRVFAAGTTPDVEDLKGIAQTLDLDTRQFEQCLASGKYDPQIETDIREGKSAGITATPTFLINGRMISGARSYREFKQEIEQELKRSQRYSSTSE